MSVSEFYKDLLLEALNLWVLLLGKGDGKVVPVLN